MIIKDKWNGLSARKKQVGIVVGLVAVVVIGATVFDTSDDSSFSQQEEDDSPVNVFSTNRAREAGIDGLSSKVNDLVVKNRELTDRLARIQATNASFSEALKRNDPESAIGVALSDMRQEILDLKRDNEELKSNLNMGDGGDSFNDSPDGSEGRVEYDEFLGGDSSAEGSIADGLPIRSATQEDRDAAENDAQEQQNAEVWVPDEEEEEEEDEVSPYDYSVSANPMANQQSQPVNPSPDPTEYGSSESTASRAPQTISTITQHVPPEQEADPDEGYDTYLTAGSIISGVLLTGMDAPTGAGARQDPFPATLRINKEAILPNRYRANVRECFMLVSGQGDLSSERAYLRAETISCITEDGGIIETGLKGYAAGEDGKAGIRGRLVSKQGSIIAKSLMAGFMSGASEAFNVNPVPIIETSNSSGSTSYVDTFDPKALQGAAASGASSALERIAQFYIDMAEGMYPVIEISAGREVNVIVTSATKLKIKE